MLKAVVINVHGGLVQDVFVSDPEIEVVLIYWDTGPHRPGGSGRNTLTSHTQFSLNRRCRA